MQKDVRNYKVFKIVSSHLITTSTVSNFEKLLRTPRNQLDLEKTRLKGRKSPYQRVGILAAPATPS